MAVTLAKGGIGDAVTPGLVHDGRQSTASSAVANRIACIDGFRAVAMLLVLGFHAWEFSGKPRWSISVLGCGLDLLSFLRGNSRVDLFIVLSGFCLFLPLARSPGAIESWDWRSFALRRAWRILPAYYAALAYAVLLPVALVSVMRLLGRHAKTQAPPSTLDVVSHLSFTHTLFRESWDSMNGSLWTMALEVHFYLAFPLLVLLVRRYGMRAVAWTACASLAYRLVADAWLCGQPWNVRFLSQVFFLGRWMQFAMGVATVWLVMRRLRQGGMMSPGWGTLGLLAAAALHWLGVSDVVGAWSKVPVGRDLLLGAAFSLLIASVCLSRTPARLVFENRLATTLGIASYSLFLVHQPTVYYASQMMTKILGLEPGLTFFAVLVCVGLACTLAVGAPLFFLLERPYLMRQQTQARRRARQQVLAHAWKRVQTPPADVCRVLFNSTTRRLSLMERRMHAPSHSLYLPSR